MSYFPPIPSSDEEDGAASDDDQDFEVTPSASMDAPRYQDDPPHEEDVAIIGSSVLRERNERVGRSQRIAMSRTASLATVRLKRRARLAEKLKDVFGLNAIEEVVAGAWSSFHGQRDARTVANVVVY